MYLATGNSLVPNRLYEDPIKVERRVDPTAGKPSVWVVVGMIMMWPICSQPESMPGSGGS